MVATVHFCAFAPLDGLTSAIAFFFFYLGLFKYLPLYAKDLNELFSNEFVFFRSVIWVLLVTNSWFFNFYLTLCRFASCF